MPRTVEPASGRTARVETEKAASFSADGHLPSIARVRRSYRQPEVEDVARTTAEAIRGSRLSERVASGGRIAITVGSRGISQIARIAGAAVDAVRGLGFRPFVVAAMGSHGGGTADGQRAPRRTGSDRGCRRLSDPFRDGYGRVGTNSFGLPIHVRPKRLRGRRHHPVESNQASYVVHGAIRERPAQDALHRPGKAPGGGPGPQARPARIAGDAPRGRGVPAREDPGRAGCRDPGERARAHGEDRGRRTG